MSVSLWGRLSSLRRAVSPPHTTDPRNQIHPRVAPMWGRLSTRLLVRRPTLESLPIAFYQAVRGLPPCAASGRPAFFIPEVAP